eukprot:m.26001 g.26001  ORF g.26001 m.26001 type:complete len:128 (+) comp29051_c0_seq1:999-1382(+)
MAPLTERKATTGTSLSASLKQTFSSLKMDIVSGRCEFQGTTIINKDLQHRFSRLNTHLIFSASFTGINVGIAQDNHQMWDIIPNDFKILSQFKFPCYNCNLKKTGEHLRIFVLNSSPGMMFETKLIT